jgi:hypothetical protein
MLEQSSAKAYTGFVTIVTLKYDTYQFMIRSIK